MARHYKSVNLADLYPHGSRLLLTGGGKEFVERIGTEAVKNVVLGVLQGENIRAQTEPLTRRRISQVCGAMLGLFANGWIEVDTFTERMSAMALAELDRSRSDKSNIWPAQWVIGLTGKLADNVLRGDQNERAPYIEAFEMAVRESAERCKQDVGDMRMTLGFVARGKQTRDLNWHDVTRLTTALGCAALTIRGSDKSTYGKLFERLILGSVLSVLGFSQVKPTDSARKMAFWLSDSSTTRESDATAILEPGKLLRFDIGFIGKGNPEISKDKLSRFEREIELNGKRFNSKTFVIVDRLPKTGKTTQAAERVGAEIIQMSMKYWPKELAQAIKKHYPAFSHPLTSIPEEGYLFHSGNPNGLWFHGQSAGADRMIAL